jgi:hypothetical protein
VVNTAAETIATTLAVTGVTTFAAGTAALPAITTTGDTNTGIFFPAADTIAFAEGGAEAMRIDSSGNLGLGVTPSAWGASWKSMSVNTVGALASTTGVTRLYHNAYNNDLNNIYRTTAAASMYSQDGAHSWFTAASGTAGNAISFTQAMTLDSSGNLLVGTTSADQANTRFQVNGGNAGTQMFIFKNTLTSGSAFVLQATLSYSPNDATSRFMTCGDTTTDRILLRSNGGIANYSANNANLSDARTKTNIENAGNYLTKICAIPVRTFKYKDQTDDLLNLGVIAQEVEAVAPELIDDSGFGETPDDGIPLKAIYQTDLQYALMKCIQEQQALITALTTRITALEAA